MSNFIKENYTDRISELTERVKQGLCYHTDTDIGEAAYCEALSCLIWRYRQEEINADTLTERKKELENKLFNYYQLCEVYENAIKIRNECSHILTECEICGCMYCKKLVRTFEGR